MARQKNGVNKSEAIRQLLRENPKRTAKEVCGALGEKGIKVSEKLYYLVKGKMLGRKARKRKVHKMADNLAASTGSGRADALSTILKVKSLAHEVGGLKKLRALVEALAE